MKRLVAESRNHLHHHRRRRWREIVWNQLLQQVAGKFRKLVLELELHPRREECGALEQPTHQGIDAIVQDAAQPFRDTGIFLGEFARLLVEQLQFPIVQIEKFAIHARYNRLTTILPLSMMSATNSTGT